jgi:hypothetical protein
MANFRHMLVNGNEPFVFPSQFQQVSILIILPTRGGRLYCIRSHEINVYSWTPMGNTLAQMSMEMCWMHEGQCQMQRPLQVMLVQYCSLGNNHYYSMNQDNLALKNNPKEKTLRRKCLFQ